jgi:rare lipoprotein A
LKKRWVWIILLLTPFAIADDTLTGTASWYGPRFHGRLTASGEVFDMYAMTAAHRKLPMGTIVNIENTLNGKSVVVIINDRGPYIDGRMIDVSFGVAQKLDMVEHGLVPVKVRIVK